MTKGHRFTVIQNNHKYLAVMIISEHDTMEEAIEAMLTAMDQESDEIMEKKVDKLRAQGVKVATLKEAIKDMSPEQLERFLEERQRKFVDPVLDANIKALEKMGRRFKIKRIK